MDPRTKNHRFHFFHDLGRSISTSWGRKLSDRSEHLSNTTNADDQKYLLAHIATLLAELSKQQERTIAAIGRLPTKQENAKIKAELAVEKAQQKTAAAQLKLVEAEATNARTFTVDQDDLLTLESLGRINGKC